MFPQIALKAAFLLYLICNKTEAEILERCISIEAEPAMNYKELFKEALNEIVHNRKLCEDAKNIAEHFEIRFEETKVKLKKCFKRIFYIKH